eukprot:6977987-Pyramimonas_sp.AAC.1
MSSPSSRLRAHLRPDWTQTSGMNSVVRQHGASCGQELLLLFRVLGAGRRCRRNRSWSSGGISLARAAQ